MYLDCAEEAAGHIDAVIRMIAAGVQMRAVIADSATIGNVAISAIAANYPSAARVAVFEHSAVVTRLYAIYERCVSDLVTAWLSELPSLVPDYATLGRNFADTHRRGIADVLKHLHIARFSSLSASRITMDYTDAINGVPGFSILPQCFLSENRTLGMDRVHELLSSVLIVDVVRWFTEHPLMQDFVDNTMGGQTTCEAELRTFIKYRNDAAHGNISDTWGPVPLRECAEFIATLCRVLAEKVEWSRLQLMRDHRALAPLGTIREVFKNPGAVVAVVSNAEVFVGQAIVISSATYCRRATVTGLQDNGQAMDRMTVTNEQEVGFKFDWLPQNGAELFDV